MPSLKCDLGSWHITTEKDLQSVVAEFFAKQNAECKYTILLIPETLVNFVVPKI